MKKNIITILLALVAVTGQAQTENPRGIYRLMTLVGKNGEVNSPFHQLLQTIAAQYPGKAVFFDFWASWCGSCIRSFPMLMELHEKYHDRGLLIIGISHDRNPNAWRYALSQHACPWPMLRETTASWEGHTSASALYAIEYFPTFVLLAPDGQVIFSPYEKHGFVDDERQQLQAKLAEIFEE